MTKKRMHKIRGGRDGGGGEQTVRKKQFDSIFHSIKPRHQLCTDTHSARLQSGLLIEAGYACVSMKLEKLISWKTVCFLPSSLPSISPSVSISLTSDAGILTQGDNFVCILYVRLSVFVSIVQSAMYRPGNLCAFSNEVVIWSLSFII